MELAASKLAEVATKGYEEHSRPRSTSWFDQTLIAERRQVRRTKVAPYAWRDGADREEAHRATDAEIEAGVQPVRSRLRGQTLEQAKPQLTNFLKNQQRQKLYTDLMADLRSKNQSPDFPRTAGPR